MSDRDDDGNFDKVLILGGGRSAQNFKEGAEIEVLEAGNSGIRYRVLSGFRSP